MHPELGATRTFSSFHRPTRPPMRTLKYPGSPHCTTSTSCTPPQNLTINPSTLFAQDPFQFPHHQPKYYTTPPFQTYLRLAKEYSLPTTGILLAILDNRWPFRHQKFTLIATSPQMAGKLPFDPSNVTPSQPEVKKVVYKYADQKRRKILVRRKKQRNVSPLHAFCAFLVENQIGMRRSSKCLD